MSFTKTIMVRIARPGGPAFATREDWLQAAVTLLKPLFLEEGITVPDSLRIGCGWPLRGRRGSRGQSHRLGQCWGQTASADGASEIFISPEIDDESTVLDVLTHGLIHAADDCRNGHRGPFRKMAIAIGLRGPMRSTHAGPKLRGRLNIVSAHLGPYPHARLDPTQTRKQGTRLKKVVCNRPGHRYCLWTTRTWLDQGTPVCPCGSTMSEIARKA
jgi:hypothetical protein